MQNFHATGKYAQERDSGLALRTSLRLNVAAFEITSSCRIDFSALENAKEVPIPSSNLLKSEATQK